MIFRFNPSNPRSGLAIVRLNGEKVRGVVFADEERGLVYALRETKLLCQKKGNMHPLFVPQMDETTGDYAIDSFEGKAEIELYAPAVEFDSPLALKNLI